MPNVNVYSRSPISHNFTVLENGYEKNYTIYGTNAFRIVGVNDGLTPYCNEMEENVFSAIKEKYKNHVTLFGGKSPIGGGIIEPVIYTAKTKDDACKKMSDYNPIITAKEMATKSKSIEVVK